MTGFYWCISALHLVLVWSFQ